MDTNEYQPNQVQIFVESHLIRAYKQLDIVQRSWLSLSKDPSALDDIANQLDQRSAITRTSLDGTSLGALPDLKGRLLSKIDAHVTQICQERLRQPLDNLEDLLATLKTAYERAGRACHDSQTGLSLLTVSDLEERTETRPSLTELFSWLDEEVMFFEGDLKKRRELLISFGSSADHRSISELRKAWKVPFVVQQRWNWIRFYVETFLESSACEE